METGHSWDDRAKEPKTYFLPALSSIVLSCLLSWPAYPVAFLPYQTFPTNFSARSVAVGDVNTDGLNDLIATVSDDVGENSAVLVRLQTVGGQLAAPIHYPIQHSVGDLADVVDLDRDGRADVVVNLRTGVGIFFQQEAGQLGPMQFLSSGHVNTYPIGSVAQDFSITILDFDGDGRLDIAASSVNRENFTNVIYLDFYKQTPVGAFIGPASVAPIASRYISSGDINNDGFDDIIVSSGGTVYLGNASASLDDSLTYTASGNCNTVGDVSGDTLEDIVCTQISPEISVLLQQLSGGFNSPLVYPSYTPPSAGLVSDMNLDGMKDVVVLHGGHSRLGVYLQQPDGNLGFESLYEIPYTTIYTQGDSAVGDLNEDGIPDIAINGGTSSTGQIILYAKPSFNALQHFPLQSGNAWTYSVNGTGSETWTVAAGTIEINGVATKKIEQGTESAYYYTNDAQGVRIHRAEFPDQDLGTTDQVTLSPPITLAHANISLGDSITGSGTSTWYFPGISPNPITLNYDAEAVAQTVETIEVSGKTYKTLRMRHTFRYTGWIGTQYFDMTEVDTRWFAQCLGVVKTTNVVEGVTEIHELSSSSIDIDGDGIDSAVDNCPCGSNALQADTDGDLRGNFCDIDDDNDGVNDAFDAFTNDNSEWLDTDVDDIGNNSDPDDDNDGVADGLDTFPLDPNEWSDADDDGLGDNTDIDDDNDGINDDIDAYPYDSNRSVREDDGMWRRRLKSFPQ